MNRHFTWLVILSFGCEQAESDKSNVNTSPSVVISSPETMSVFTEGDEITFQAVILDDQQEASTLSIIWNSDADGILLEDTPTVDGQAELVIDTLTEGLHVISLTAIDDRNASGRAWIQIEIDENEEEEETEE